MQTSINFDPGSANAAREMSGDPRASDSVTYYLLRSGVWGVRGPASEVRPGHTVRVERRDRSVHEETIKFVLWTDGVVSLATLRRVKTSKGKANRGGRKKKNRTP